MSRPCVKWRHIVRYFKRHGYEIAYAKGGEAKIVPSKKSDLERSRPQVVIGHKCCSKPGDEVYDCYLKALERAFGVTREDILHD